MPLAQPAASVRLDRLELRVLRIPLIAPFTTVAEPFDLSRIVDLPGGLSGVIQAYADRIDPAVVVAMVAWALIGGVVVIGLRLVFR